MRQLPFRRNCINRRALHSQTEAAFVELRSRRDELATQVTELDKRVRLLERHGTTSTMNA